jgi:hypothetical protein
MATFHDHLIINRWLLSLFNQRDLQDFKTRLGDDRFSGLDESGQTRFFEQLNNSLFHSDVIDEQTLHHYDFNIVQHWQQTPPSAITQKGMNCSSSISNICRCSLPKSILTGISTAAKNC